MGVNDLSAQKALALYPNPVKAGQEVQFNQDVENVEVFSATGKRVKVSTNGTLNTNGLAKGVYFVRVKTENGKVETKKLMVK